MKKTILLTLCFLLSINISGKPFEIKRGVNISHWLSQSPLRGEQRAKSFTEKDVKYIASLGFDHLRIPIDEEQMFKVNGEKEEAAFNLLHNALTWCDKYNLKAIVDLHILRSHHFNNSEKPLFTDTIAQNKFYECWHKISGELKNYSNDKVAYELMNEPVADEPEIWNKIVNRCLLEVRALESERFIVIGSNRWQSHETVKDLRLPENDKNIIISFHYYLPFLLTHYQAPWTENKAYKGPVHYPGKVINDDDYKNLSEVIKKDFGTWNKQTFDLSVIKANFEQVLKAAKRYGLKVYCGEYGCIDNAPKSDRDRWFNDMNTAFNELGIARAVWEYKAEFGLFKNNNPDQEMIKALTK